MRSRSFHALLYIGLVLALAGCAEFVELGRREDSYDTVVIRNGNVITLTGSDPIRNGIVAIEGNRIIYVGSERDFSIPQGAEVLDAGGGTILPGIIDAHTHGTSDPKVRRDFLAGGVTTVCDLGSPLIELPDFNIDTNGEDAVARGVPAGPILTAPGGLPDVVLGANLNYEVSSPEEGRAAVVDLHSQGAEQIKVYMQHVSGAIEYPMLDEATLTAIVEEAHAMGLLVRAHVTYISLLEMAVSAGVDTIEHVPINSTQAEWESASAILRSRITEGADPVLVFFDEVYLDYEAHLRGMVEADIVLIPTLERPFGDLLRQPSPSPEATVTLAITLGIVERFHELDGIVALGTDFNVGSNLEAGMPIGEMEMLLAAGLSPLDIIEAGTRNSAIACGIQDELGTLESGKLADVIVVDGNPLEDLMVMEQVMLVLKDGAIAFASERMQEIGHRDR